MRLRVSNRVFWAIVFLIGCGILADRAPARQASDNMTVRKLTAREVDIVDSKGRRKMVLTTLEIPGAEGTTNAPPTIGLFSQGLGEKGNNQAGLSITTDEESGYVTVMDAKGRLRRLDMKGIGPVEKQ